MAGDYQAEVCPTLEHEVVGGLLAIGLPTQNPGLAEG